MARRMRRAFHSC